MSPADGRAGGRPLHVLAIGMNYAPEPVGVAVYSTGLAEGLAARGHRVTWIAATPYYPSWRPDPSRPRGWSRRQEGGVRVLRCPHPIPARPTAAARVRQQAIWTAAAAAPAFARAVADPPDVVIAVAPGLIGAPLALAVARLCGAPAWLHLQDFEAEAAALVSGPGRAARLALGFERRVLGAFDAVSTITPAMRARLLAKGVAPERTAELRNWAELDAIRPARGPSPFRVAWGLEGRRVALYSGNLGAKQGLETLVGAAARLRAEPDLEDLDLVICGDGAARPALERAAAALGPGGPRVLFRPLQPFERLDALLALADIHLLPQRAAAADLVMPSKLANMLASGRPVVAGATPDTQLATEVAGCGLLTPPEDPGAFAAAIAALARAPRMRETLGRAARARAEARWSRRAVLDAAEAGFAALAAGRPLPRPVDDPAGDPAELAADAAFADAEVRVGLAAEREEAGLPAPAPEVRSA